MTLVANRHCCRGFLIVLITFPGIAPAAEIRILSDRTPSHLAALFEYYEQRTGVGIDAVHVSKGLIARLRARPTEADLVITSTADILEQARREGLLSAYDAARLPGGLAPDTLGPDNRYLTIS